MSRHISCVNPHIVIAFYLYVSADCMLLSCTRYGHWLAYGSWMVRNLSFGLWPLFQLWKLDLRRRWLNFLNFSFLKPYSKEQILIAEILLLCNWIESKWGNKLLILFCFEGVGNDPREDRYFSIPKQVSSLNYHSKSENLWFIYFMVWNMWRFEGSSTLWVTIV